MVLRFLCALMFFTIPMVSVEENLINIKVKDAELFCRVVGKGDPLIVIHGGPGMPHDYLLSLKELAKEHQIIFYDQRATGRSTGEVTPETMQYQLFVEDIDSLRNSLGLEKISIIGHSWVLF